MEATFNTPDKEDLWREGCLEIFRCGITKGEDRKANSHPSIHYNNTDDFQRPLFLIFSLGLLLVP